MHLFSKTGSIIGLLMMVVFMSFIYVMDQNQTDIEVSRHQDVEIAIKAMVMSFTEQETFLVNPDAIDDLGAYMDRVLETIKQEPGYFHVVKGYHSKRVNQKMTLTMDYQMSGSEHEKGLEAAKRIVNRIVTPNMSEFEKQLAIHDYLVQNVRYVLEEDAGHTRVYTLYGALVEQVAVCSGYADAFHYMASLASLDTLIVEGTADGIPHAWNMIHLDNNWYHVDVTWNATTDSAGTQKPIYTYFNLDDAHIQKTHIYETANYPQATSMAMNYYHAREAYIDTAEHFQALLVQETFNESSDITVMVGFDLTSEQMEAKVKNSELIRFHNVWYRLYKDQNIVEVGIH